MSPSREVGLVVSGGQGRPGQGCRAGADGRARRLPRRLLHRVRYREPGALPAHGAGHRAGAGRLGDHQLLSAPPAICAQETSYINEVSGGRMDLGLGTAHQPTNEPRGIDMSKAAHRVAQLRGGDAGRNVGRPQPLHRRAPRKMTATAGEISDGAILNMIPKSLLPKWVDALQAGAARADGRQDLGQDVSVPRLRAVGGRRLGPRRGPAPGWPSTSGCPSTRR